MEYSAYKYKSETMEDVPQNFENAYYDPKTKDYAYYACTLIVKDDNTYELKGPDEGLKKYLDEQLRTRQNRLDYPYSEKVGNTVYIMSKFVSFIEPGFQRAFDETVSSYGLTHEYSYSAYPGYKKVDSISDVKRLDAEYAVWLEQEIARRRARRAEKEKGNT